MNQSDKNIAAIRLLLTSVIISEYALLKLIDGTKHDLKMRVKNSIASCRHVQDWFLKNNQASPETKKLFKECIMGDEIVLLSELLETCFGIEAAGLEEIIAAIKSNTQVTT